MKFRKGEAHAIAQSSDEGELIDALGEFYYDPLGFVMFAYQWGEGPLSGFDGPDVWQTEFFLDVGDAVRERDFDGVHPVEPIRMSRASGHGIGKSALTGMLSDWITSTRPFSDGVVTANTVTQLRTKTWAQIVLWKKRGPTAHWFDITTGMTMSMRHVNHPETWKLIAQTAREENSESFAGLHAATSTPYYIFDEASAVPSKIYEVAQGGLTDGEPHWYLFGNATRNVGFFYDASFGRFRHRWNHKAIDSRTCAIPNKELIAQWVADYGEDSDFVRVRVRGLPPRQGDNQLISGADVDAARVRMPPMREAHQPFIVGVDPARFGDDLAVIRTRRGADARGVEPKRFREIDNMQLAARVFEHVQTITNNKPHHAHVFIDSGNGTGVIDRLRQLNLPNVHEVSFGGRSNRPDCHNKRTEMYVKLSEALASNLCIDDSPDLVTDLTALTYSYTPANRKVIVPKEVTRSEIGRSIDDGDALALTYAEPVGPIQAVYPGGDNVRPPGLESDYDPYASI